MVEDKYGNLIQLDSEYLAINWLIHLYTTPDFIKISNFKN